MSEAILIFTGMANAIYELVLIQPAFQVTIVSIAMLVATEKIANSTDSDKNYQ